MKRLSLFIFFYFFVHQSFAQTRQQCNLLETSNDTLITCLSNSPCVTLHAYVMEGINVGTNTYRIENQTTCPLPQSNIGTITNITEDDRWSSIINLPFTFYFFGQPYTRLIIGANGVLSFDLNRSSPQTQRPNDFCQWSFDEQAPNTNLFRNTIFGAFHDVDVRYGGTIRYYVAGRAPQRMFVVDYDHVAHFQCHDLHTSQRVILYESTNVIDVQIIDKPTCTSWNNGNALIAIQNEAGTVAYVPPGRNTGPWSARNELWRFIPNDPGGGQFTLTWYDMNNNVLGTGDTLRVCPATTTSYRVELAFDVGNQHYTTSDTVTVNVDYSHDEVDLGPDRELCIHDTLTLDATVANATAYQWQRNGSDIPGANQAVYHVTEPGTYAVQVEIGLCHTSDTINVTYSDYPIIDLGPDIEACAGDTVTLDATPSNQHGNETYEWSKDGTVISGANGPTLDVTETGTYVATVTNNVCTNYDTIYVHFQDPPPLDLGPDQIVCSYDDAVVASNITDGDAYIWEVNGTTVNTTDTEITLSGTGEYDVVLTMTKGVCTVTDSVHVKILSPIVIDAQPEIYGILNVTASGGLPDYQYALNDGDYQSTGHFEELPDGDYTVHVRDANNCEADTLVHVINLIIPPYFTPNNDGTHDTWRIINSEYTPDADLYIYDRFGRLVKHMNTAIDQVWDGTYNGLPLGSTDYWFVLVLPSGRVYKGHFALIR